jgi:hypothetical protein
VYYSLAELCFTLAVGAVFIPVFGTVISIVLGIVGAILCIWGDADKRTLLQTWLDRCAFGKAAHCPDRYKKISGYVYQWTEPEHLNTAIQAVRGAWMGLDPQVEVYEDVMYFYNSSTAMYWYQNGNEMCLHMDKFHYQGVLAYSGTVAYPKQMQPQKLMGVAFDENQLPVVLGVITELEDQKKVFSLLEDQLGEPLIVITKDPSQEGNIPAGIPTLLWYQARGDQKLLFGTMAMHGLFL